MKAFVLIATLLVCVSSFAGEAKTVKLLTIGNSFSANATHYLGDLAKAGGHTLIHQPLVIGGASFQVHTEKAQKHEADPKDKAGLYTSGRGLKENLELQKWDYVTIQQSSIKSHDFATYQPYAGWLRDYITKHAPQAKLLVQQLDGADATTLREAMDRLKDKLQTAVIVLATVEEDKVKLVAGVTSNLTAKVNAGQLANFVASQVGGKGGGRPDLAQAGGPDVAALPAALESVQGWVAERLG
jgi:alanyl-tRNA synthetase